MRRIKISDARAKFSEIIKAVMSGEEFLVTKHGEEVARLAPLKRRHSRESVLVTLDRLRMDTPTGDPA